MSPTSKKEYLKAIVPRYRKASRKEKSQILTEFCSTCNYNRKYAIELLNTTLIRIRKKAKLKPGRPSQYNNPSVIKILKTIWKTANFPCSKRLKTIIPLWLPYYESEFEPTSTSVYQLLKLISPATIDRLFKPIRPQFTKKGLSTTKPGSILKKHIPIKTNQWDESRPGFLEADTVAHCGSSTEGQYVNTIDTVDIASAWTEQRAVWGKGQLEVQKQLSHIEASLPFPLLGFDSDNGSEFLNHHIFRFYLNRKQPVQFTRSRAYHKNDNAHVEQKNWSIVREWIGYDRFDIPELVPLLNDLYSQEWRLFHNFFCPSVKLISKQRIKSKIIKIHDSPKTPAQRLIESPFIPDKTKQELKSTLASLNPFHLRRAIDRKLKHIFKILHS